MNIFLFFDTYYVNGEDSLFSFYSFLKDFVVPAAAIYFSIKAVYWGINKQNTLKEIEINIEKENEKVLLSEIIKFNNPILIESIKEAEISLDKTKSILNFKDFTAITITTMNSTNFDIVKNFGYVKIIQLIDSNNEDDFKIASKYWVAIDSVIKNYTSLNNYLKMIEEQYRINNNELNRINHEIAQETSVNIHGVIPPFTTIHVSQAQIESDPLLKQAIYSNEITNQFKESKDSHLIKIQEFLKSLSALKDDEVISKGINAEYAQKIVLALEVLGTIENLFDSANKTITNYLPIFDKNKAAIEKFNELISKKDYKTPKKEQNSFLKCVKNLFCN
ncbi:hypothetical protein HCX49_21765 [Sphingobacterium kitahiroshimense]|uniref:hypothetical protein n=1 Tax=Sphingobacterium sp. B16(2022) TaxID=2914044 RepID=UPI001438FAD6|nr:hypothetical protein [Sphingobacterium sp. B16(2022)]NJI75828.1 hypothetical protein [Sphingobacterium sp. B16(2022)]